ncbi:helix-turn-helix domain-containing protein [Enterococcus rotai]|uniref:helix-turn-helix domain-containing protein n=1 Tax=Enterococcus rotai TaxID=118060 RepID=UPI0032B3438F
MEINLKAVGLRIKQIRKQHNYSMARFANLVGNSSASTVNNWEKGNNLPKQDRLEKIAILGSTTADWIRYGDFENYVTQLLNEANLPHELSIEQLQQLILTLKKQKITYTQDLKILTTASNLFPVYFEKNYPFDLSKPHALLISEDSTTYSIEQNDRYRTGFLPMIEALLHDSDQKELNASVLFLVFDLLKRTESNNHFLSILPLFKMISDIVTNDITYRNKPIGKIVNYDDLTKKHTANKGKPLSGKIVLKKYSQTKKDLIDVLDAFYSEYNNPQ